MDKEFGTKMHRDELGEFLRALNIRYGKKFFVSEKYGKERRYRIFTGMWKEISGRESKPTGTAV
jgi:hypothetical protein